MPELDPPTLGEIIRRLDEITARQERMLDKMDRDRAEAAKLYVRQDVYIAERQLGEANIADIRTDLTALGARVESGLTMVNARFESGETKRRQFSMWLITLSVTVVLGVAGLIVSILMR